MLVDERTAIVDALSGVRLLSADVTGPVGRVILVMILSSKELRNHYLFWYQEESDQGTHGPEGAYTEKG